MSGYFKSLMKQSGVSIGASNSSVRGRETASRPVAADPIAPLHVETVAFVGPPAGDVEGKTFNTPPAYVDGERLTPGDPISVETAAVPPVVPNQLTVTGFDQTEKTALDQSEPDRVEHDSVRSVVAETTTEMAPEVNVSITEVIESRTRTAGGVVRVGEQRNQELVTESDAPFETTRMLARPQFSIPPDYLEGIREWLNSPPVDNNEITTERLIDQPHDKDANALSKRSVRPPIEVELSSPDELQEFNLSIGSISIVVEEPARQPPPPSSNLQPVERAPANTQPRVRDAFALSRSYFRGF